MADNPTANPQPAPAPRGPPPTFTLTFPPELGPWNKPVAQWFRDNDKHFDGLAVGALVFSPSGRILLIQRAAHDSMPNLWEIPGGGADPEDVTLLHAAARELWEEAGLVARGCRWVVTEGEGRAPGSLFTNRTGNRIFCRFSFEMEVGGCVGDGEGEGEGKWWEGVRVDPEEHQDFLWATEEEVKEGRMEGGRKFEIANGQMRRLILEGFRLRKLAEETATGEEFEAVANAEVGEGIAVAGTNV